MSEFFPVLLYLVAILGFAAFSLVAPHLIAPRKKTAVKDMPYESGMDPVGDSRKPLDIRFYLIAILFLVFDIELLLAVPFAVALKADNGMLLFVGTLALAYLVAWRRGVFHWRTNQR
jgi:NADH-quinone oxidoreductase subunit A